MHEGQLASQTKKTCVVFSKVQRVYLKTQKLLSAATNKIWGEHLPTFSKLAPGPFPHGKHGDMKKTAGRIIETRMSRAFDKRTTLFKNKIHSKVLRLVFDFSPTSPWLPGFLR